MYHRQQRVKKEDWKLKEKLCLYSLSWLRLCVFLRRFPKKICSTAHHTHWAKHKTKCHKQIKWWHNEVRKLIMIWMPFNEILAWVGPLRIMTFCHKIKINKLTSTFYLTIQTFFLAITSQNVENLITHNYYSILCIICSLLSLI